MTQWLRDFFFHNKSQEGGLTLEIFIKMVLIMTSLLSEASRSPWYCRGAARPLRSAINVH